MCVAGRHNLIVLEDDPYYFLQFESAWPPSLASMDRDGRVLRFDSMSKVTSHALSCMVYLNTVYV